MRYESARAFGAFQPLRQGGRLMHITYCSQAVDFGPVGARRSLALASLGVRFIFSPRGG